MQNILEIPATKQALRTLVTAIIAFTLYRYFAWPQGYWIVLTALMLVQIRFNNTFFKNMLLMLVFGLMLAANTYIANAVAENAWLFACYLFLTTFVSMYIGLNNSYLIFIAFTINLFGAISGGNPEVSDVARMSCVLLGVMVAAIIINLLWPFRLVKEFKQECADYLTILNELQKKIFNIYLKRDYQEKHFYYEKELHRQRQQIFGVMQDMRNVLNKIKKPADTGFLSIFDQLDELFEIIVALGNVRHRVQDYSTFEVCEKELDAISKSIAILLTVLSEQFMGKKISFDSSGFVSSIETLEAVYGGTLRVVSKEPIAFLIFIQILKEMNNKLKILTEDIKKI